MNEHIQKLPKSYFKAHPLERLTFARLSFFQMAWLKPDAASALFSEERVAEFLSQEYLFSRSLRRGSRRLAP